MQSALDASDGLSFSFLVRGGSSELMSSLSVSGVSYSEEERHNQAVGLWLERGVLV